MHARPTSTEECRELVLACKRGTVSIRKCVERSRLILARAEEANRNASEVITALQAVLISAAR